MPRKRTSRIYTRTRGGATRYYADFRDFADQGGGREALVAQGETLATTDEDVATELAGKRLKELESKRRGKAIIGVTREDTLHNFAADHLRKKAKAIKRGKMTEQWVQVTEKHLTEAIDYFSATGEEDVASISVQDVRGYLHHLEDLPNGRGRTISGGTQRHYLNALSNLFERAQSEGLVPRV